MAERFQAANGVGLVVGSNEMQFAVGAFYQTWLARNGEFFFMGERITPICSNWKLLISP